MARLQVYSGEGFEVTYDPKVCTHSAECVRALPGVFNPKAQPWIRLGSAVAADVEAVVARCPSGALRFVRQAAAQGPGAAPAAARATVQVAQGGPLILAGEFEIRAPDGTVLLKGQKAALCRCGHSGNKPFCDGAHKASGFTG
jgi:uncharacterized Fe-S cluster protein YjdI